jgi:hypothetical protein
MKFLFSELASDRAQHTRESISDPFTQQGCQILFKPRYASLLFWYSGPWRLAEYRVFLFFTIEVLRGKWSGISNDMPPEWFPMKWVWPSYYFYSLVA